MEKYNNEEKDSFEDKIINWIVKKGEGRITIYKPTENEEKSDLIIKKRARYKDDILHLRIKTTGKLEKGRIFVKDITESDFRVAKNFYLIFAYFDPVERKINDYLWLVPSTEFQKLAEKKEQDTYQPKLRFEAPLDPKKESKYTPFVIEKEELVDILLKILASPEEFEFAEVPTWETKKVNISALKEFITEARQTTYASGEQSVDSPRLMGSSQFEHQEADFFYRDIYFDGDNNFIGQEIVYQNKKPIWGMIYFGKSTDRETTAFLKKSLLELAEKCRLGEKCEFQEEAFHYLDSGTGTLERFSGEERILKNGKEIYDLSYRGGMISGIA